MNKSPTLLQIQEIKTVKTEEEDVTVEWKKISWNNPIKPLKKKPLMEQTPSFSELKVIQVHKLQHTV
jgi:hypothetical protein